jgi:DNA-directed RNA polymerase subunit RPC12/RpoP
VKLPETICSLCGQSKINGLFTPLELQTYVRCRVCIGEINVKRRPHLSSQRLSLRAGKGVRA